MQGLLIGFWYVDRFSPRGITNKTMPKTSIDKIPINLSRSTRRRLNVAKRYHSGSISKGVENGWAGRLIFKGSLTASPDMHELTPKITIGNMYKISLGHPGSP
jgi:hypothetical protein